MSLAWGLYLAVSWTWCIGLFLPVILAADTGPGAWTILLVCNVGGVMALPWLVGTGPASLAFAARTRGAAQVFSVVTMLCQAWFAGWAARRLPGPVAALALGGVGLMLALGRSPGRSPGRWLAAAAACWAGTLLAFAVYYAGSPQARLGAALAAELPGQARALYGLPLVFAGFALCPSLDLTFQHALQAARWPGRAFAAWFPVPFAAMLVVSLGTRDELGPVMREAGAMAAPWLVPMLAVIIVQVGFTAVLHGRHLPPRRGAAVGGLCVGAGVLAWAVGDARLPTGQTLNEGLYRASIGFYGVIAPTYVWAVALPGARLGPAVVWSTLAAVALAAVPMLLAPEWLVLYPLALVPMVLARFVARRARADAPRQRA